MESSGTIGYIDLSRPETAVTPMPSQWRSRFLGGRTLNAYLAFRNTPKGSGPLDPGNSIVLGSGILSGLGATLLECAGFSSRFPLTGRFGFAAIPGGFGAGMRRAGFDHLVISGRAGQWVYLLLHEGQVQVLEAFDLKGKTVPETLEALEKKHATPDFQALVIGASGENRVHFAEGATREGWTFGKTGAGALLGAKKVKAVVCCGTRDLWVKSPGAFLDLVKSLYDEGAAAGALGSVLKRKGDGEDLFFRLCRDLGVNPETARKMRSWAQSLAESGVLSKNVSGRLGVMGNGEGDFMPFVRRMARRKGAGVAWQWGPLAAAERLPKGSLAYFPSLDALFKVYCEPCFEPLLARPWTDCLPDVLSHEGRAFDSHAVDDAKKGRAFRRVKGRRLPALTAEAFIANSLGIGTLRLPGGTTGKAALSVYRDLVRLATGFQFREKRLVEIAFSGYALERLLDIREAKGGSMPRWVFRSMDGESARALGGPREVKAWIPPKAVLQGWEKASLVKRKVFRQLGIEAIWPLMR